MTVVNGASLLTFMLMALAVAILAAVAFSYFFRPKARRRFQGGSGRYFAALFVQAAGFMTPILLVWFFLIGAPVPAGVDVLIGVALGVVTVALLRLTPVTGPLLKELTRARVEARTAEAQR